MQAASAVIYPDSQRHGFYLPAAKTITINGFTKGDTFYVRTRLCKKVNGKTKYSKWTKTVKVKIKK